MIVIPAIDLVGGRVVRLEKGDFEREKRYAVDPVDLAKIYAQAGAQWLHVVDLDGAVSGDAVNLDVIEAIATRAGIAVQAGGGVRSEADFTRFVDAGVSRVVVGSLTVREPESVIALRWRYGPESLTLALDARADAAGVFRIATAGWKTAETQELGPLLERFAGEGFRHFLVTDIERDGMLAGPNLALYQSLRQQVPDAQIIASGGVGTLGDLQRLREIGAAAVVVGKALLEGRFSIAEALA
jgi:phosphoribosylformimino-5-aminoimidazole carboxamide ribotide isomerase